MSGIRDDHRAAAGAELSSMVADLDTFSEPEDSGQPIDGRSDIVIGEDRQHRIGRNRCITHSHHTIVFRSVPTCNIRIPVAGRRPEHRSPVADPVRVGGDLRDVLG
jgi:hypothetical protein